MSRVVAVIGASSDRRKFGNKAVRAFTKCGYQVIPINLHEPVIEDLPAYRSVLDYDGPIDLASLYLVPTIGLSVLDEVASKGIHEVWLNPGAHSPVLVERAVALGITPIVTCSIIRLGESPADY